MDKLGIDSSNWKTEAELEGRFLEYGKSQEIIFPDELIEDGEWRIAEWFFEKGQIVNPGDAIGAVEDRKKRFEFETYVGGKLNYFKQVGQKVDGGTVLAEIIGTRKS
jgi:pyruvate/2-oxoglutarate dehydrogenase complex dihydrolipoamide acyltransferase (E2) component